MIWGGAESLFERVVPSRNRRVCILTLSTVLHMVALHTYGDTMEATMAKRRAKRSTRSKATPKTRRNGLSKPTYTEEECEALLDAACDPDNRRPGPSAVRNRALVAVLWRTGLRISEALALTWGDLVDEGGEPREIHLPYSKSAAGIREVSLDLLARVELGRWLEVRRKVLGPRRSRRAGSALFCTISTGSAGIGEAGYRADIEPVSSSYVRSMLTRLGERAGLSKRIHAHGLRRTHASELVAEGAPLTTVQAQLGHAAASTTSVYLGEIGTARKDLIAARLTKAQREEMAVEAGGEELVTISRAELDRIVGEAVAQAMRKRRR